MWSRICIWLLFAFAAPVRALWVAAGVRPMGVSRAARVLLTAQPIDKETTSAAEKPIKDDKPMESTAQVESPEVETGTEGLVQAASKPSEAQPPEAQLVVAASSPFTLQKRGDGWDDLRQALVNAGKERQPSLEQLQKNYVKPVERVAKVLADEVLETIPIKNVSEAKPKAESTVPSTPSSESPTPEFKPATRAAVWFANTLDGAVAAKQKKKASQQGINVVEPKTPSQKDTIVASFNIALLLAIPTVTLAILVSLFNDAVLK
uniref:Transmembrane protein n=2 Tax=Choreotrichia TaxID=141411 RepID=A0A7S3TEI5_9SPIT|mmetsp:Transcript_16148/g.49051  ORF Transcript_16148/g.49051 Transcript_16148/m.49051 type:complete len:263 (-) Transcript_16148:181-969(-)|eukprot:scaffold247914_cov26-Tisochrysis_lutea.AAC.1